MGFNLIDLDDYSSRQLMTEVSRRSDLLQKGFCPYCSVKMTEHTCKFKGRELEYHDIDELPETLDEPVSSRAQAALSEIQALIDERTSIDGDRTTLRGTYNRILDVMAKMAKR